MNIALTAVGCAVQECSAQSSLHGSCGWYPPDHCANRPRPSHPLEVIEVLSVTAVTAVNLSGHVRRQGVQAILVRGESKLLKGNDVLRLTTVDATAGRVTPSTA